MLSLAYQISEEEFEALLCLGGPKFANIQRKLNLTVDNLIDINIISHGNSEEDFHGKTKTSFKRMTELLICLFLTGVNTQLPISALHCFCLYLPLLWQLKTLQVSKRFKLVGGSIRVHLQDAVELAHLVCRTNLKKRLTPNTCNI